MKFLPEDMTTASRATDPEMLLLGIHVGYRAGDNTATAQQTAFCRAVVRALLLAANAGGYSTRHFGEALIALMESNQPMEDAASICACITPEAWSAAMLRPDFETTCEIV